MGSLARVNPFYWKYRRLFIPGLLFAIVSAAFSIVVPIVVRHAVDSIPPLVAQYEAIRSGAAPEGLARAGLLKLGLFGLEIIGLSVASGFFSFLTRRTLVVASRHIEFDLRNQLYEHLQKLSQGFYHRISTGDVITRASSDIEQVRRYIGPALMYASRAVVIVITAGTVMFIISPTLTLYALIPMPFLTASVFVVAGLVHSRSEAIQKQYARLTTQVQEALSGVRVLKAYTREKAEAEAFGTESMAYRQRMLELARLEAFWRPVFLLLIGFSTIIVVWVGGRLAATGAITVGNIAEYLIYVTMMTWPVASIGFVINMIQRAAASADRLYEIIDSEPDIVDSEQTDASVTDLNGAIAFENVVYRYAPDTPAALERINFSIEAGTTLGIVGRTGSGKSTLIGLIPRLFDPREGTVRIDGHDARTIPVEVLRRNIGYIPQETFLFSDTIANNIAFGKLDASSEQIDQAATEAELLENVQEFPDGFDTFVGERGITLSGGQKQRTSIARALIRDPRILILDDALSAVDTNTERNILNHLRKHYGKRTIVVVSHRISAVQEADLILVMDQGCIVERGTHDDLVEKNGLYAGLYRKQLLDEELSTL